MATRMLQRRGTEAEWEAQNPILAAGELGITTDTKVVKVGDGITAWNNLETPNMPRSGGEFTGPISIPAPTQNPHAARKVDVDNAKVPIGGIIHWWGDPQDLPITWAICDGTNGTPNLVGRFIVGAGGSYSLGDTGGANAVTLTVTQIPGHTHSGPAHSHTSGSLTADSAGSHAHSSGSLSTGANGSHSHNNITRRGNPTSSHGHPLAQTGIASPPSGSTGTDTFNVGNDGSHSHSVSGNVASNGSHTHNVSGTTASSGTGNTGSTGGGNSHENRPPYIALWPIMRVA